MSVTEQQYQRAYREWITARQQYKRTINNLMIQLSAGLINAEDPSYKMKLTNAYNLYQPVAKKYLDIVQVYIDERPELAGHLMYEYMEEAALAQSHSQQKISNSYMDKAKAMAVESAKVAYADWSRNGNGKTMAGVFAAIVDAQMLDVDNNPEVSRIADEVFIHFEHGKMRRDPTLLSGSSISSSQPGNQTSTSQPGIPTTKGRSGRRRWKGQIPTVHYPPK